MNHVGFNVSAGHDLEDVKQAHLLLRQELAAISHWRRLLRARMDLCTAVAAPPKPIGVSLTEYFDSTELRLTKEIRELPSIVVDGLETLRAFTLPSLKEQDSALRDYERAVRKKYMILSDDLAQRHARKPQM